MLNDVLIAGAGAIGLTVAETFFNYNPACVSVLAEGERLERYRRDGLWVNGKRLPLHLVDASGEAKSAGLVIVSCKNHHLENIIESLKPFVGENTIIVSLLNGISSEDEIGAAFGRWRLPLALIIATDSQRDGSRVRFTQRGVVHFGDAEGDGADEKAKARDEAVAEFFGRAGLPFVHHPIDMKRMLWFKYMINVGANQVSALLKLPYKYYKRPAPAGSGIPEACALVESAMNEVVALANAQGISLGPADIEKWYDTVEVLDDAGYTSMAQDAIAGRKTEVELFGQTVCRLGKQFGIATPVNEALYRGLRACEKMRGV